MRLKNTILSIILLTPALLFSQLSDDEITQIIEKGSKQKLVSENSRLTQEGFLFQADKLADKLISMDSESPNFNYRKGFLVLKLTSNYSEALPFFLKATQSVKENYDMYSSSESSAPTDAYFYLGTCYHMSNDIENAKKYYQLFIDNSKKQSELLPVADLRLIQCSNAIEFLSTPFSVELKNLGNAINTSNPEYSSVVSLDGSSIYFTSRRPWANNQSEIYRDSGTRDFPEDIYVSYLKSDSTWSNAELVDFCMPNINEATISLSPDERSIFVYQDTSGSGDIYYSDIYNNKFNKIKLFNQPNLNTEFWETHCFITNDGKRLFFTSDRPGGYGGRDIYVMNLLENGNWSNPINMGPTINSAFDEDAPFVSVDNSKLYYSSNGPKSMGGFDILYSNLNENGTWSESINLGYPFNSTNDDIYYTTTVDGLTGYMTSVRQDGKGEKDIYEIKNDFLGVKNIAVFKGIIKTTDGSNLPEDFAINIKLSCDDCSESDKNRMIFPRLRDGLFMTGLKPCKTYRIAYNNVSDKNTMYEETFTTDCELAYQEIFRELLLDVPTRTISIIVKPIEIDTVDIIAYKNIEFINYFDYNKNKLTIKKGDLKEFVENVEKQLIEGRPSITINVYSSASNVPTKSFDSNMKLSQIRAENMKYDLVTYFENNANLKGKVNVVIVSAIVDGPEYSKDAKDIKKYRPYQFVGLKTE